MATIPNLHRIKHLVWYSELAYKNDTGIGFRMAAQELKGTPVEYRYLQIVTPVWKSTEPGLISKITSNTIVHLGIRNGDTLVLAFRGTDFPMSLDTVIDPQRWKGFWSNAYTDISYRKTALIWEDAQRHPSTLDLSHTLIHEGFLLAFNSLLHSDTLLECIEKLRKGMKNGQMKFDVCGHSLGGALATLCALWCKERFPSAAVRCVTLGSPRVGNAGLQANFEAAEIECYRLVNDSDPVPTIPDKYADLIPLRIRPSNPDYHIKQRDFQHTGSPIWLHVGKEIVLHKQYGRAAPYPQDLLSPQDPPEVQRGESKIGSPDYEALRKRGIFSWKWIPYWTGRAAQILYNIPSHNPVEYTKAVGKILENSRERNVIDGYLSDSGVEKELGGSEGTRRN
ncbi:unnamed protein product [Clonostachys rosea f. rosea IK726]|uniref:Fungal lipase-type domain-containing protein n=2 Tax=Bionectria ochroleuca TaxID=29856 RepID=A0A0B7KQN4_BIOOC|nr:unnamed protein product [Clonostachys rosea f. rosea IK726]